MTKLGRKAQEAYSRRIARQEQERRVAEIEENKRQIAARREHHANLNAARESHSQAIHEEDLRRTAAIEAHKAKLRGFELERDRQWMTRLKELQQRLENVQAAIRQLGGGESDLSSPEAAIAAAERASRIVGLRDLLQQCENDLHHHEQTRPRPAGTVPTSPRTG